MTDLSWNDNGYYAFGQVAGVVQYLASGTLSHVVTLVENCKGVESIAIFGPHGRVRIRPLESTTGEEFVYLRSYRG